MKRYCLALDLKDDPQLIAEYEHWHKAENGWPEIKKVYWMRILPICRSTVQETVCL
jgi:hypothetical protein